MEEVKCGAILVREQSSGQWGQRLVSFDTKSGLFEISDPSSSTKSVWHIPDRKNFKVRPSPYMIPQYPLAVALHLYPVSNSTSEDHDLHISALDRREIQEWSYFLQNWSSSQNREIGNNSLVPDLSEKEETLAKNVLDPHLDQHTVLIDKLNIPISRRTLHCLTDGQWLSDEIVNFYFSLLHEKAGDARKIFCWNSFFFQKLSGSGYAGVRNWTARKQIDLFDLEQVELVLMPVHLVDHWALGVVNMREKTTMYLDSLGTDSSEFHKIIVGYLDEEFSVKHASEPKPVWKKSKSPKNLPLQSNGSDCGVFICMYALALASGGNLQEATAERVPVMRRRIACDIVRGRVKKWPIIV